MLDTFATDVVVGGVTLGGCPRGMVSMLKRSGSEVGPVRRGMIEECRAGDPITRSSVSVATPRSIDIAHELTDSFHCG
jgi:hypothetical protein